MTKCWFTASAAIFFDFCSRPARPRRRSRAACSATIDRSGGPRAARRHRDDHRDQHQHQLQTRTTNESGYYTFPSLKDGTYRVVGRAGGLQEGRARRRDRGRQHDHPRRPEAGGRRGPGVDHRRRPRAPVLQTDRTDTGRLIESKMVTRHPAHLQPQLPGPAGHGAGRDAPAPRALGVLQLAGLALDRGQRPVAARQQHDDRRRRRQPEDRPAPGDHPGGRRARDRQRHHQQLRRGVRPLGRRHHQRHAQVGHQHLQGHARSSSATTRRPTPATTSRTPRRRPSSSTAASRSAARSCSNKLFFFGDYQRTVDNSGYIVRDHRADRGDAQRRLQRGVAAHLRPADRRRQRHRPRAVRQQP